MPSSPYAKVLMSIDSATPVSGGVTVTGANVIQLSAQNTTGWFEQLWEIYEYPVGFACPAGWNNVNGVYMSNAVTPPSFLLPTNTTWGKFFIRLTVNGGLLDGVYCGTDAPQPLVDESCALSILSPRGLTDVGHFETNQFNVLEQFGELKKTLRVIETGLGAVGGAGTPGGTQGMMQYYNLGSFGGAPRVRTDGTYLAVGGTTGMASAGDMRVDQTFKLLGRNHLDTADITIVERYYMAGNPVYSDGDQLSFGSDAAGNVASMPNVSYLWAKDYVGLGLSGPPFDIAGISLVGPSSWGGSVASVQFFPNISLSMDSATPLGVAGAFGAGLGVFRLDYTTTPPSANVANALLIYAEAGNLKYRKPDGTIINIGTGSVGGLTGQVQWNNGGAFAGATRLTTDGTYLGIQTSGLGAIGAAGLIRTDYNAGSVPFWYVRSGVTDYAALEITGGKVTLSGTAFYTAVRASQCVEFPDGAISIGASASVATTGTIRTINGFSWNDRNGAIDYPIIRSDASENIYIGTTSSYGTGTQVVSVNVYAYTGGQIGLGLGGTTYLYITGTQGLQAYSGSIAFGASGFSSLGNVRFQNTHSIYYRNAANTADLCAVQSSDTALYIGEDNTGAHQFTTMAIGAANIIQVVLGSTVYASFNAGTIAFSQPTSFGASPAGTGAIRMANAQTINARNVGGTADIQVIGTDASNNVVIACDASLAAKQAALVYMYPAAAIFLGASNSTGFAVYGTKAVAWQGVLEMFSSGVAQVGTLRFGNTQSIYFRNAANSADICAMQTTDTALYIGEDNAGAHQFTTMAIAASNTIQIVLGASVYASFNAGVVDLSQGVLALNATTAAASGTIRMANAQSIKVRNGAGTGDFTFFDTDSSDRINMADGAAQLRIAAPVGGHGQATTPAPFRFRVAPITLANTNATVTLGTADYECPIIRFGGTGFVDKPIVFPNQDGATWLIDNQSSNNVIVKVSAGTGFSIPSTNRCWIYCDGTDIRKVSAPI